LGAGGYIGRAFDDGWIGYRSARNRPQPRRTQMLDEKQAMEL